MIFAFTDQEAVLARGDHVINTPEKEDIRVSVRCDNNAKSRKQSNASANQVSVTILKQTDI